MMQIYDRENENVSICAMHSSDGKSVYVSFCKGVVSASTFIGKDAAREFAENILEIVEDIPDYDHNTQIPMPFMAEEAA